MKNRTAVIIAVFSALLGIFLVISYTTSVEEEAALNSNVKNVVVAKKYIPKFSVISPGMCKIIQVPAKYIQPNSLSSIKELIDEDDKPKFVSLVPILEDESILSTKVTIPGKETGLAVVISKGMRAFSIPISEESSAISLIKPGNKVDLISTFEEKSVYLLQNILVLSVGNRIIGDMEKEDKQSIISEVAENMGNNNITLAVEPEDALKIAYVKDKCSFNIVLRSSFDDDIKQIPPVNQKNLFGPVQQRRQEIKIYKGVESFE